MPSFNADFKNANDRLYIKDRRCPCDWSVKSSFEVSNFETSCDERGVDTQLQDSK